MEQEIIQKIFSNPGQFPDVASVYDYYRSRKNVKYFPVVDPVETSRERVIEILANRFEFNRETYHLPNTFDWLVNPGEDIEWHILLHKFYYASGLGEAYVETGDEHFLSKWAQLIDAWIDQTPPGFISSDVTGRRVQNWIFSHYFFVTRSPRPCLDASFYLKFLRSLHEQTAFLCKNLTPKRNHRTLELTAIFMAAVVFPEMRGAKEWLSFSRRELLKNICEDLLPDGVQCELSTDYHHIVLRNYLRVRKLAQLNDIVMPSEMDLRIQNALDFAMHCHKPDGRIPSLSDGDTGDFRELLQTGYELYGNEKYRYVASGGREGMPPQTRSKRFADSGYIFLRSGWGTNGTAFQNERYLAFDCGPVGAGNHGHLDLLSFELAAFGQSLIVDPGRYTYHEAGAVNWRALFRGTSYHNTVVVNGRNQARYQFHPRKKKFWINGPHPQYQLKTFESGTHFDFIHGVAKSAEYDAVHERAIFFAAPEYWIISDFLRSETGHLYDLLFHLSENAANKTRLSFSSDTMWAEAPHLLIAQTYDEHISMQIDGGYVSPVYGVKHFAPVIRFTQYAANAGFHSVVFPFQFEKPHLQIRRLKISGDEAAVAKNRPEAFEISIERDDTTVTDLYFVSLNDAPAEFRFAGISFSGKFLYLRKNAAGEIIRIHKAGGAKLSISSPEQHYV